MKFNFLSAQSGKAAWFLSGLFVLGLYVLSCGSSRQDNNFENPDEDLAQSMRGETEDPNASDAEVLRLLGITPNEQDTATTAPASVTQKQELNAMDEEIAELKDQIDKKDREITLLRTQLTQKESRISDLEARIEAKASQKNSSTAQGAFKSRYENALQQYRSRNYNEAISLLSELLKSDSENSLSDNCQYWIGECYYGLKNYNQAINEFEKVFLFPNSNKVDDAQLKLGLCYMRLGDKAQARAEFDRLLANYPNSEYKSTAQKYLAKL